MYDEGSARTNPTRIAGRVVVHMAEPTEAHYALVRRMNVASEAWAHFFAALRELDAFEPDFVLPGVQPRAVYERIVTRLRARSHETATEPER